MAKGKRGIGPVEPSTETQAAETQTETQQATPRAEREKDTLRASRLSVPLTGSNGIDWEHMRESNREQVKNVIGGWLRDPKIAADFGIEKPLIEVFSADWCASIYDAIGAVERSFAPKLFGCSQEAANFAFTYSEQEKTVLAKPTAAVINKYAFDWMIRFKEEIQLALLIFSITGAKIALAKSMTEFKSKAPDAVPATAPNGKEAHVEQVAA